MIYNERGSTLIQVLVATGMMAVIASNTATILKNQSDMQTEIRLKSEILEIRQVLLSGISNDSSWTSTVSQNLFMKCLTPSQAYCQANGTQTKNFKLYDAGGKLIYDSVTPTSGFTLSGATCNTYSANGNDQCPIRADINWKAVCTTAPCGSVQDIISIGFTYSPSSHSKKMPLNVGNYNVNQVLRTKLAVNDSPLMNCARQGMIYIGIGKTFNSYTSDIQGCVAYQAFVGPQGPQGPMGPEGPAGPVGAAGTCIQ